MMNSKNRTGGIDNMRNVFVLVLVSLIMMIFLMSGFVSVAGASCGTNLNCIAHKTFVYTTICLYPDACTIHVNSLWDGAGANLYYGPGSNLADNIIKSSPQGGMTFKEIIKFEVKSKICRVYPNINCVPIGNSQTINIFSNSNEFASGYFDLANNPGLFFAFGGFHIFPDGLNQPVTLTRVGENDYKVTGTINIYLNDYFVYTDQEWTDQWAYRCQQAGCIHNFWTRVDMNFAISDLEFPMNSQNMHCDGDPEKIQCCPEGCVNKADLSASLSADSPVNSGDTFTVKMTVSNAAGSATANNVAPSSLSVNTLPPGDASATCGGHSPTSANIPGGSSQDFRWTCTASGEEGGTLKLSASASGTDACSGETVTASSTTSNTVTVEVPEFLFGLLIPLMSSVLIYFTMRGRIKKR